MKNDIPVCERVQMAAMAHLDGEQVDLTPADVEAHLAGCAECRAAVSALAALQSPMSRLGYESIDVDVWPGVRAAIDDAARLRSERRTLLALAAVLALWRLAQLSFDLPAPVVNSVVPLTLIVLVLRRVVGDPFAIQSGTHQFQEEGVR